MKTYRTGTVVYLKSGGPAMTVKNHTKEGLMCTWFVGTDVKEHNFEPEQLTEKPEETITGMTIK